MPVTNFFALVSVDGQRELRRLRLSAGTSTQLSTAFHDQAERLWDPDVLEPVEFDPGYTLEGDEVFRVPDYVLPEYYDELTQRREEIADMHPTDILEGTKAILAVERSARGGANNPTIMFQQFTKRQALKRKEGLSLIFTEGRVFNMLDEQGIQLNTYLDAVLIGSDLYFRSATKIRGFLEVTELVEAASDEMVRDFADHDLFAEIDEDLLFENCAGQLMRKRIALVLHGAVVDNASPREVRDRARACGIELEITRQGGRERLVLPSDKATFKKLVRLLNDDFLDSPLTQRHYSVSSKRPLRQGE